MKILDVKIKRRKVLLTINQKLTLIEGFKAGFSTLMFTEEYGGGAPTVQDIVAHKKKLEQFTSDCDIAMGHLKQKMMKFSSYEDLDSAMRTWFY